MEVPHRRWNPLAGRWVLVSPQRLRRPWNGATIAEGASSAAASYPEYDRACSLCPRNERASGARNPDYHGPYVFGNDFPAVAPAGDAAEPAGDAADDPPGDRVLVLSRRAAGMCRVLCYSEDHRRTLARLDAALVRAVVDAWVAQYVELSRDLAWVQIFENRGAAMGCSSPHPHGQIWGLDYVPNEAAAELRTQTAYCAAEVGAAAAPSPLLLDYARRELAAEEGAASGVVHRGAHWLLLVPYWAEWPYETLLLPWRRHIPTLADTTDDERGDLAGVVRVLVRAYERMWGDAAAYSMGWHNAPGGPGAAAACAVWQLHLHAYPPLLTPQRLKYRVGFEMLSESQRDGLPDAAAAELRAAVAADLVEGH